MAAESRTRVNRRRSARCFNEAAAMWPRKVPVVVLDHDITKRFNEAAAMWPRKATTLEPRWSRVKSFNEAAAMWPRKEVEESRDQAIE